MEVRLTKEQYYLTSDDKFNQKEALKTTGEKAAVCFKSGDIKPWDIRENESDEVLIKRGIGTILSDHVTPSQQVPISLEIYNIPKILCMYLENIGMQTADERSLRYTELKPNANTSEKEINIYYKWLGICEKVLWDKYHNYFIKINNGNEKKAMNDIHKLAQENARMFVSVFANTSLTYTTNLAELNKLAMQIEKTINASDNNELENRCIPYLKEFIEQLKNLKIIITNNDIWNISPVIAEKLNIPKNEEYLYKNPKSIDLNLFTNKNKFMVSDKDEFGTNFHAVREISFAGYAQAERHRTIRTAINLENNYELYMPEFIKDETELRNSWVTDSLLVKDNFPQGQIIKMVADGTLADLLTYFGGERACSCAQVEIANYYLDLINDYYLELEKLNHPLKDILKPYVNKYRCMTGCYKCPSPCKSGPRVRRKY